MRRLIVNADDFGLTEGVNRAIAEGYSRGIVTSATLMANSSAFASAAELGTRAPNLSLGCHVVLIDGGPRSEPSRVSTLVQDGAFFRDSILRFAYDAVRGRIREEHIYDEAAAQFKTLIAAGIQPSHFDTHKHVHMFPSVLKPLLRAARDYGIRAVRNPFVPVKPLAFAHLVRRPRLWTRYSQVKVLRTYQDNFLQSIDEAGMVTTDGTFGIVATGSLDLELFRAIIGCIPEGTWEFDCHPGYVDAHLLKSRTRLKESREQELRVLTSAPAREALERGSIELISFRQLLAQSSFPAAVEK